MTERHKHSEKFKAFNLVVFGGDGDLALRKIFPAIFHRELDGQFLNPFNVVSITRRNPAEFDFKNELRTHLQSAASNEASSEQIELFIDKVQLIKVADSTPEEYNVLKNYLNQFADYQNIYYFSTPSSAFGEIALALKSAGLINADSKVVLEKPLGFSLASSNAINADVRRAFKEQQIYRIDHYLGKETVQNLMVLRFANNLFERAWDSEHIDNIQITVSESLGVEKRGAFYDNFGALLDMVQNHLLQLLCLVAMEPPQTVEADEIRNEKLKVLRALRPFTLETVQTQTVKGQYTRGMLQGQEVNSYLEDINKYNSKTETFVAIKTFIDNWRWKDVPVYLRTGKRMKKKYSEIVINFKEVRHNIFQSNVHLGNNRLIIRLQPEERIELIQMTKVPGPGGYRYKPIALKLDYVDSFKERFPDAYERLIIDVIRGNQTLFMRLDEVQASWNWIESITSNWKKANQQNILYEAGTWGPGDLILDEKATWITKSWKDEAI